LISKLKRKDLELLLLGMALHPSSRQELLDEIPEGFLSAESEELLRGVRGPKRARGLMDWLADRGARLEKGELAVDAVIRAIRQDNQRNQVSAIAAKVKSVCSLGTPEQIVSALEKCLAVAKEFEGVDTTRPTEQQAKSERADALPDKGQAG
jgi:hypothetical protein